MSQGYNSAAIVLVLFILLVIILATFYTV
ncbi:YjcZ family sporulation protein [Paenibacillus ferrarius]